LAVRAGAGALLYKQFRLDTEGPSRPEQLDKACCCISD
jgi:hypothetical protein